MRQWKVIESDHIFGKGDIVYVKYNDNTSCPYMGNKYVTSHAFFTKHMAEIDEDGNTIRTYKKGDKLNEGTLVGGNTDKKDAMKRLDAIENEAKELRKILEKPDRIEYDFKKIYVLEYRGTLPVYKHILLGTRGYFSWYSINNVEQTFNGTRYECQQDALDCVLGREDCTVHTFTNRNDALKFMMENS